jgi:RND family efflux transporter MFP subunit
MPAFPLSRTPSACALRASLLGLALLLCPAAGAAAASGVIALSADQQTALGVRLASVQPASVVQLDLPARVSVPLSNQAVVSAPAAGMVRRVLVDPGAAVRRGQPLVEFISPQIAQLQRERSEAQTRLDLARRQLQRDTQLVEEGIVPRARLDAAQAQAREAQAQLAERDLAVKLAAGGGGIDGVALLRAPIDGVLTEVTAVPGQRVDLAAPLVRIAQQGPLWLEIDASPQQAASIRPGAEVVVPAQQARGVVQSKSTALSAGQSVPIRVRLTQPGSLLPGAVVQARLSLPAQPGTWRVPPAAVTQIGGRDAVLVRAAEGFRVVAVRVAGRLDDVVMVRGALKAGDLVAASGVVAIKAAAGEVAP